MAPRALIVAITWIKSFAAAAKLKQTRQKLRERLREKPKGTTEWLQAVVRGYLQYHAVPCNVERLKAFRHEVLRTWWWQLRRRSQRSRWTWEQFQEKLGHLIPEVEILHPYPEALRQNIQGKNRMR